MSIHFVSEIYCAVCRAKAVCDVTHLIEGCAHSVRTHRHAHAHMHTDIYIYIYMYSMI